MIQQYLLRKGITLSFFSDANAATRNIQRYGISETPYSLEMVSGRNDFTQGVSHPMVTAISMTTHHIHDCLSFSHLYMKYAEK